jgi:hypothetical protein
VRVVRELTLGAHMNVSLDLLEQPERAMPAFGMRVEAVQTLGNGCAGVADSDGDLTPDTHLDCVALAQPEFNVTFSNGVDANAVRPNLDDPEGGYHMSLRVLGNERYLLDQIPVYLVPSDLIADPVPPLHSASGSYEQEVVANGCVQGEGPLWLFLLFEASIPEGTELAFEMCGADSDAALTHCTFSPVATVRRGGACVEQNDCGSDGYCDPSGFCNRVQGIACEVDEECGTFGTCAGTDSGRFCTYARNTIDLQQSGAQVRGRPRVRVRARLSANSDRTQAPTLLRWTLDYSCAPLE